MMRQLLLAPIIIPLAAALALLAVPKKLSRSRSFLALTASFASFLASIFLFKNNFTYTLPWLGLGLDFSFRLYNFSAFIILAVSIFGFLVVLYSMYFMKNKPCLGQFYSYLLVTLSFSSAAVLSDNLLLMLFFWEGLLLVLFAMIAIGNSNAFKAATKAFIIVGLSDLCMMVGIALCGHLAQTYVISKIQLQASGMAALSFILLATGAIAKVGAMPFHTWIPDAARDAPLPFMALVPASLDKLLGIYFLARISLDMFKLNRNSPLSILLMSLGAATILAAVMMALIQKNSKRLLAYHAVSQAGYMILGLGTALPMGIIGGLFHMLNNAIYKCGLFLSAGALEQQAGTTDLEELGGLGRKMPLTFICFIILALSISGVPPLNGFFSKELIYDAALERGFIFYLAALLGSFFTAASFLKFGHAAFLGKISDKNKEVKEAPWTIFMPLVILSLFCVGLGLCHQSALNKVLLPLLGSGELPGHDLGVFPLKTKLVSATLVILLLALFNHIFGVKRRGSGLGAVDHIHFAPGLNWIYLRAEGKCFDPFRWGGYLIRAISGIAFWLDRTLDWFYEVLSGKMMLSLARRLKKLHTENYSLYLTWSLVGLVIILCVLIYT